MNFSLLRFAYGFVGAFLGFCLCWFIYSNLNAIESAGIYLRYYDHGHSQNTVTIIVTAMSFFSAFLWWEQIFNFLTKSLFSKDKSIEKEKNHE
jgi:hypothetical protein